jgi:hypothetical protein
LRFQALCLGFNPLGPEGAEALLRALQAPGCPRLRDLPLPSCLLDRGLGPLPTAMRGGACGGLLELDLGCNRAGAEDMRELAAALGEGACPGLRGMDLGGMGIDSMGATALARVIARGKCPALERLNLDHNNLGDAGVAAIAAAIQGGACPRLRELDIYSVSPACLNRVGDWATGRVSNLVNKLCFVAKKASLICHSHNDPASNRLVR